MPVIKNIILQLSMFLPAFFLGQLCCGQSQHSLIEYTTENGLSLNSVNDLHFDKQGFLWVTTADGLQKFDGYRFQTFRHDDADKKSLPENSVSLVYEDMLGNFWLTHRTGLCFKPKGRNEFTDLTAAIMDSTQLKYPLLCVNETDSSMWVLKFPAGIYSVNKVSLQINKVFHFPEDFNRGSFFIVSLFREKGDRVWFRRSEDKTADLFEITDKGILHYPNKRKEEIHFLIKDRNDSIVVITDKVMYKALAADPFEPLRILKESIDASDFSTYSIPAKKIANGQYLLQGIKKIWTYDSKKEELAVFPYEAYFPPEQIRYLHTSAFDQHQNSWLGYNGIGGIKVISVQKFNLFKRPNKDALTYTLTGDEQGKIFAGIYLGDIEVYDKKGQFLQKIELPDRHTLFGSPRAMAMIDSVTLVVKSTLNELYAVDTRKGTVRSLTHLLPSTDSLNRVFEMGIQKIGNAEVWVSYYDKILSVKKKGNEFTAGIVCTLPAKEQINSIYKDDANRLWIGSLSGLWLFEKGNVVKIPMPTAYVKHVNQHPDGSIWLATTNGLYILDNKKISRYLNIKDGLPNSFVYSVLFDDAGNGWVSTNRGLAKISRAVSGKDTIFSIINYSAREGLQGDEFNTKGYYRSSDGTLYFAGVNGINFFKPQELVSKDEPSKTMLTEIEVNNQPYLPELQPEFINNISLPYYQNNIRLSFACMDFTVPEKNQYKFWLKGFQNNWTLPQKNNTVQYILPPGEYDLHVLSANYEGVWSKEPLVVHISILPPWYQTTWAIIIFAILALSIVAAVFFFISRNRYQRKLRTLQMEQEVQKEKQRLSRDLHDNLGAQITWLSNNISQVETAQQQEQPVGQKMSRLKEGAGELMQTLRETIWILNKDKVSAIEFFDKLVSHASKYIEGYPSMRLHTEEDISSVLQLNSGQALQLFRICQEAVTNACKHSGAAQLTIVAASDEKHFSIRINDNGKGFDSSKENPGHYGLQNMQQRAEESGLTLTIQSEPGKGTHIIITAST
ncbi:MAG TPA: triple tyrosine motif-containing protein [Ferruginibacter sp.]|nr:triple tyrosine motif-containing protein [Ferruginibacter sp.]